MIKEVELNVTQAERIKSVKDIIDIEFNSNKIDVLKEQWQSPYNKYLRFDYEPFVSEGWDKILTIKGEENYINYLMKIIEDKLNVVNSLNECLEEKKERSNIWTFKI